MQKKKKLTKIRVNPSCLGWTLGISRQTEFCNNFSTILMHTEISNNHEFVFMDPQNKKVATSVIAKSKPFRMDPTDFRTDGVQR